MSKYNVKNGKGMLLPDWIVEQMLDEQERQGNKRDVKMFETRYTRFKLNNGFDWEFSEKGNDYWFDILVMGIIPDEPKKPTYPRVMMVSANGDYWVKRVVEFEKEIRGIKQFFAWSNQEKLEDILNTKNKFSSKFLYLQT